MALAIFAMVITAIYASWIAILRSIKVGSEAAADIQRSRIAMQTLEDALSCARSFQADVNHYSFIGENGEQATLSFVAQLPAEFPRSGKFGDYTVRRVTFALEPGADKESELVLRQNSIFMDPDKDEVDTPLVLARHVKEFDLEFWDQKNGDWAEEWTETNQLPLMVQVSLVFSGADRNSTKGLTSVSRTLSLPSIMVATSWQTPNLGRRPGGVGGGGGGISVNPGGKGVTVRPQ